MSIKKAKNRMKLTPRKISENEIKHQVKQYLSIKGYFHFHLLAGMGCYPGLPDRIAIKDGQVYFIEVKKPVGSKHNDNQKEFKKRIEKEKGIYLLVKNLEDLIKGLEGGEEDGII